MTSVSIKKIDPFFLEKQSVPMVHFEAKDYLFRLNLLQERMKKDGLDYVVIFGDREHFANIEYFSSYDCRFEEGLLVIDAELNVSIIVGNEGLAYSHQIPYSLNRYLYRGFSLQGQPRNNIQDLIEILQTIGLGKNQRIGVCGYKYFLDTEIDDSRRAFDLPEYLMKVFYQVADQTLIENYTKTLTGLGDGIRQRLYSAKEVAWAESQATKAAAVVLNIIEGLKEGVGEREAALAGKIDLTPVSMFGLLNFGPEHVAIGLRSSNDRPLKAGEVCGVCYGIRGSLCSRNGVAAYDLESYDEKLKGQLEDFYMYYWRAIASWYETAKVGSITAKTYDAVMSYIGDPKFNVELNPGHHIGMDEWTNSPFYENSPYTIQSGNHFQVDMIATSDNPVMSAICEDTVVFADAELRKSIQEEYPELWQRILKRQEKMRSILGIQLDDSLLPMSNLNGVYFPFMLNTEWIMTK